MTSVLETQELVAGYDGVPAVHGVSVRVDEAEIVTILGPNGAGKTTTLLAVAGVLPVMAGAVSLLGQPVGRRKTHDIARCGVTLVPEDRGVFFQLTVAENLRLRRRGAATTATGVYDYFPALAALQTRRAGLLSGGEQQMLALGCALLANPRLLMVDELSHGLAPVVVAHLVPLLRTIASQTGMAVLLVEQHFEAALSVAARGYVMNRGRIVAEGTSDELRGSSLLETSYLGTAGDSVTSGPSEHATHGET